MLFHKRTKKALRAVWIILGVLIIISMVLLYAPIFTPTNTGTQTPPVADEPLFDENTTGEDLSL